jgi:hypothetical protein
MVTIKGFQGLSNNVSPQHGRVGNSRFGVQDFGNSQAKISIRQNDSLEATQQIASADVSSNSLSATDRASLSGIESIQAGTTALKDLIEKIQTLAVQYQQGTSSEKSALRNEISALSNEYNNILQSNGNYTSEDVQIFSEEMDSLADTSSTLGSEVLVLSSSLSNVSSSLDAVTAAVAPTLALLSDISSSSLALDSSLAVEEGNSLTLAASSTAIEGSIAVVDGSITALNGSLTTTSSLSNDLSLVLADVESSIAATVPPTSLTNSSSMLNEATTELGGSLSVVNADLSSANDVLTVNSATLQVYTSDLSSATAASGSYALSASMYWDSTNSETSFIALTPGEVFSSRSLQSAVNETSGSLVVLTQNLSSLSGEYAYWQPISSAYADSISAQMALVSLDSDSVANASMSYQNALDPYVNDSVTSESIASAGYLYDLAVVNSANYQSLASEYDISASSMYNLIVASSFASLDLESSNSGISSAIFDLETASGNLVTSSSLSQAALDAVIVEIAAYQDPDLASSSNAAVLGLTSYSNAVTTLNTALTGQQGISATLSTSLSENQSTQATNAATIAFFTNAQNTLESDASTLSAGITTSLTAIDSLGSTSSSLQAATTRAQNTVDSLADEITALAASSSAAALEVASGQTTGSLNEIAESFRDYGVEGLTIDLSTRYVSNVSNQILTNRLSQITATANRLAGESQAIQIEAHEMTTELSTEEPSTRIVRSEKVDALSKSLANSILAKPTEAMGAIGNLNSKTVLTLVQSIMNEDKR